jgi:hypothetical protein
MATLPFKPKQIAKQLLSELPDRARDVLIGRYGLSSTTKKLTLEAIGKKYGITRERVRQIENYALNTIRKSDSFKDSKEVFDGLQKMIEEFGGIVSEEDFLNSLGKDDSIKNHINFLLVLGDLFVRKKEDSDFRHRWFVDEKLADKIHESLHVLYKNLEDDELVTEAEFINTFLKEVGEMSEEYKNEEIAKRWLGISKKLGKNPLGEWGKASSSNVKAKGMRDYAYLAIKQHGSPMHFSEVAKTIADLFDRKAHIATCHNELIKDSRFVLVGRGLYALSEWGYTTGVVKDVISEVLKEGGALSRDEIIEKVRNERYVKDNTIIVNLQDTGLFKRGKDGKYTLAR